MTTPKDIAYALRATAEALAVDGDYHYRKKWVQKSDFAAMRKRWIEKGECPHDVGVVHLDLGIACKYRATKYQRENCPDGKLRFAEYLADVKGPVRWDALTIDMKKRGWPKEEPVTLEVCKDGTARVLGNFERLSIARKMNLQSVPAKVVFCEALSDPGIDDSPLSVSKPAIQLALRRMPKTETNRISLEEQEMIDSILGM